MKNIAIPSACLSVALAFTLGVGEASAQKKPSRKKTQSKTASTSTVSKTRARRVTAGTMNEAAPDSKQAGPSSTPAMSLESDAKPAAEELKPEVEPSGEGETNQADSPDRASKKKTALDPIQSLRDEIDLAPGMPQRIRLQLKLAEQLVLAGKKTEAISELRAVAITDAFDPDGFYNTGNALVRLGEFADAISVYRKAIEQRKGHFSRALNNLGVVLIRERQWDEAQDALLSALKIESFRYAEASYNLGRLYAARGERDLAVREWRRALTVDPQHTGAANALTAQGAAPVGQRKIKITAAPSARESQRPTVSNSQSGDRADSRFLRTGESSSIVVLEPAVYEALERARTLREQGKGAEAVENYKRVIARSGGYLASASFELGCLLMNLGRYDEALVSLEEVANRDGALYPLGNYFVGRLYAKRGELALAETSFVNAANAYKHKDPSILLELSGVREKRADFIGALAALEEYLTLMEQRGIRPSWVEKSLTLLRQKAGK